MACYLKPIMYPIRSNLVKFQNPGSPFTHSTEEIQVPGQWSCLSETDIDICRVMKSPLLGVNEEGHPELRASFFNRGPFLLSTV